MHIGDQFPDEEKLPGTRSHEFLTTFELYLPSAHTEHSPHANRLDATTWTSPDGHTHKRLDHVALPLSWRPNVRNACTDHVTDRTSPMPDHKASFATVFPPLSGLATHSPPAGTHNLRPGTVLGRAIVRNWDAPSSSGHARMHLEPSWDAPLTAPGALHPRAGTHECTWNTPGTRCLDLGQIILEQAHTECSWNSPGTHHAHQPRAGTHGIHVERSWDAPFSGPGRHHPRVGNIFCSRNHQPRRLTKIYRGPCRTKAQSRCITQIMMYIAAAASSVGTKIPPPHRGLQAREIVPPNPPQPDPKSHQPSGRRWFNDLYDCCQKPSFPCSGEGVITAPH